MPHDPSTADGMPTPRPSRDGRREFLKKALGGAGVATATALAAPARTALAQAAAVNDPAILNFALNLEYLEAEFYNYAVTGMSIEAAGVGTGGASAGGIVIKANPKVTFSSPAIQQYAAEIAMDERNHVTFIRNTLAAFGVAPAARPTLDLLNSFVALGNAIGVPNFDPFAGDVNFLLGSYIFEDVGVSAYHGASTLIKNLNILSAAAGILAVEAYHSGIIRTLLFQQGQGAATQAISGVRASLSGAPAVPDYGVAQGANNTASLVVTDSNSIAPNRTTRQVLNVVYGAQNATSGLFFPNGLNGSIR